MDDLHSTKIYNFDILTSLTDSVLFRMSLVLCWWMNFVIKQQLLSFCIICFLLLYVLKIYRDFYSNNDKRLHIQIIHLLLFTKVVITLLFCLCVCKGYNKQTQEYEFAASFWLWSILIFYQLQGSLMLQTFIRKIIISICEFIWMSSNNINVSTVYLSYFHNISCS